MLIIYFLIAVGAALLVMEPWVEELSWDNALLGIAIGLAWPLIASIAVVTYLFLAIALRARG